MFRKLFDSDLQQSMMNYFTHELSTKGRIKAYDKNQIINPPDADYIYIVLETKNKYRVIISQAPYALTLWAVHVFLMYTLAF